MLPYYRKSDKYHDIKDINGGNHLLFWPTKGNMEESSLLYTSNNSFMFHYSQSSKDLGTKEEHEALLNWIEIFHKNKFNRIQAPKVIW
jgi:hypothetical protein